MWRFLLGKQWWRFWACAAAFMVLCVFLGRWQWDRYAHRLAEVNAVTAHYDAPPEPFTAASPLFRSLPTDQEWTHVEVTCRVPEGSLLLVRNRPGPQGVYGYEAVTPCTFEGDAQRGVLLNLGWVPNGPNANTPPVVATPPSEQTLTVRGWLRPGEISLGRDEIKGQLSSIEVGRVATLTSADLGSNYVVVGSYTPTAVAAAPSAVAPRPRERPDNSMGSHLAYALQWWAVSCFGFILVFAKARREYQLLPTSPARTPKPARQWVWDDEDE